MDVIYSQTAKQETKEITFHTFSIVVKSIFKSNSFDSSPNIKAVVSYSLTQLCVKQNLLFSRILSRQENIITILASKLCMNMFFH